MPLNVESGRPGSTRSGYLTEAANCGIPLPPETQQSLHKSMIQSTSYYNDAERKAGGRHGWSFDVGESDSWPLV